MRNAPTANAPFRLRAMGASTGPSTLPNVMANAIAMKGT